MQTTNIENTTQKAGSANAMDTLDVRTRCPNCLKLYSVPLSEITEEEPRFNCNGCNTQFVISLREALESEITLHEIYTCPKCGCGYGAGDIECKKCGVIFLKLEDKSKKSYSQRNDDSFSSTPELRQLWEDILNDYDKDELHRKFINTAWANNSLDYAAYKYATILEVLPSDQHAVQAQREITALMTIKFQFSAESSMKTSHDFSSVDSSIASSAVSSEGLSVGLPVAGRQMLFFRNFKITNVIMFLCGILIVMGVLLPHMRNLVGFGSAILGFILVLRYYFRVI